MFTLSAFEPLLRLCAPSSHITDMSMRMPSGMFPHMSMRRDRIA